MSTGEKNSIILLPSKPEEVEIAVPLIYSSGPSAFEYVFQNKNVKAQDFLKYAFVSKGGEFSYENHHSLYYKDKMVGIGSAFDAKDASGFTFWDGYKILKYYGFGSASIIYHGLKIEKLIKLPILDEVAIAHLGIKEELRGKGLGTYLVHELMKLSTSKTKTFILDVSEENPRAHLLYAKLGFNVTVKNDSILRSKYSYVANHFRMELPSY